MGFIGRAGIWGANNGRSSIVRNCLGIGSALFGGPETPSPGTGSYLAFHAFLL